MPELEAHLLRKENRRTSLKNADSFKGDDDFYADREEESELIDALSVGSRRASQAPSLESVSPKSRASSRQQVLVSDSIAGGEGSSKIVPLDNSGQSLDEHRKSIDQNLDEHRRSIGLDFSIRKSSLDYQRWVSERTRVDVHTLLTHRSSLKARTHSLKPVRADVPVKDAEGKEPESLTATAAKSIKDGISFVPSKWSKVKTAVKLASAMNVTTEWGATHSLRITSRMRDQIYGLTQIRKETYNIYVHNTSSSRAFWDMLGLVLVLYEVFYMPYVWTFNAGSEETTFISALSIFIDIFFLLDIGVNMLTVFQDPETLEDVMGPPRDLVKNYFHSGACVLDFLSGIPWSRMTTNNDSEGLQLLKVVRFVRVLKIGKKFFSKFRNSAKAGNAAFTLVLLMCSFATVVHLLCCAHFATFGHWINSEGAQLYDDPPLLQYASVLTTVLANMFAAGIIVAETANQHFMISVTMCLGALASAVIFGSVAHIIGEFNEGEARYLKFMLNLTQRMNRKQLPSHIRNRVFQHYENQWKHEKTLTNDRATFLQDLSPALSKDVSLSLCRDIIDMIPVKMHPSATEALVLHMDTLNFLTEDLIMRAGDVGDWLGFVGQHSQVGVHIGGTIVAILEYGMHFGETCLFTTRHARTADIVALSHCQIHALTKANFEMVFESYPNQLEKLRKQFHSILLDQVDYNVENSLYNPGDTPKDSELTPKSAKQRMSGKLRGSMKKKTPRTSFTASAAKQRKASASTGGAKNLVPSSYPASQDTTESDGADKKAAKKKLSGMKKKLKQRNYVNADAIDLIAAVRKNSESQSSTPLDSANQDDKLPNVMQFKSGVLKGKTSSFIEQDYVQHRTRSEKNVLENV